jgi:glycosyltransferase involved in cell wall biosynthesis
MSSESASSSPTFASFLQPKSQSASDSEDHHVQHDPLHFQDILPEEDLEERFTKSRARYNICLVSDFFYPRMGGVEMHQYFLAQGLLHRGHKVVLITGCYESQRFGIRYMTNGLKVYYCPVYPLVAQASPPNFFSFFPLFRNIMIREKIQIVHGHQTTSFLAHECILHAKTMGIKAVFTDHSLFGFADPASIHVNKFMKVRLFCLLIFDSKL